MAELTGGEGLSNRQAAEVLGVDEITIRRDRDGATNVAGDAEEQIPLAGRAATNAAPEAIEQVELEGTSAANAARPPEPETPPLPEGRYRRHLDPVTWGEFFGRYCEARIANSSDNVTDNLAIPVLAADLGVPLRTAERRLETPPLPEGRFMFTIGSWMPAAFVLAHALRVAGP